jgi:hypothetical protein
MKDKVLRLTLKKKWFDMIASGEKKEEYREVKDYWMKRIAGIKGCGTSYNFTLLRDKENRCLDFDYIEFKNGYSKHAPTLVVKCKGITIDEGKKKWGAPDYRVFIIHLGEILALSRAA